MPFYAVFLKINKFHNASALGDKILSIKTMRRQSIDIKLVSNFNCIKAENIFKKTKMYKLTVRI